MSRGSAFEEQIGTNDGTMDFPALEDGQYIFEEKNMVFNDGDQLQHEMEVQLAEELQSDVSATVLWRHVIKGRKCGNAHGGSHVFKCKYCQKIYHGTYTRVYAHLMGHKKGESKGIGYCSAVKADKNLQLLLQREVEQAENSPNIVPLKKSKLNVAAALGSAQGPSLALSYAIPYEKDCEEHDASEVDSKVMRCLCANGIPFDVLRSPYWAEMVSAISKTSGYRSPTYERAQAVLLQKEQDRIERQVDELKQKWPQYGISVLSSGWTDMKNQSFINILAANMFGSIFIHALDFLLVSKSQKSLSDYMLDAVQKVGPYNVVQLITDNAASCKAASEEVAKMYPNIFWNPCMVHTLKLVLKDTIRHLHLLRSGYRAAKGIVRYIIHHSHALEIFQQHPKLELLKIAATRDPSHYILFQLMVDVREALHAAVLSDDWERWVLSPNLNEKAKLSGDEFKHAVLADTFWNVVQIGLHVARPIYKMIKFIDRDGPVIGEVCERMDNMLGEIKDNLQEDLYIVVKERVHYRWNKESVPLQCLAYALTPKYYDEEYLQLSTPGGRKRLPPDRDDEIWDGANTAITKLYPNVELSDTIRVQFIAFVEKKGKFSSATAKRDARNPKINVLQWWKFHGGDTKELRDMAFRVLAQPISTSSIERPWSTYGFIQDAKRNTLNGSRADGLMYIHSNLRLFSRVLPEHRYGPFRKWDVHPDLPLLDESALRWDDMHFIGLDDENPKQLSQSQSPNQEFLRIIEAPGSSHSGESSHGTNISRSRGRGRGSGGSRSDQKGKTKKFL